MSNEENTTMVDVKRGRELLAKATPGEWDVYVEDTPLPSDVYRELEEQARYNVDDKSFTGRLVMLTDGARAPAITGCGPASHANAEWIAWAHNNAEALLSAAERVEAIGSSADETRAVVELDMVSRAGRFNDNAIPSLEVGVMRAKLATAERRVAELEAENASAKDSAHKYYVKARVYGAIAAKFNEVLTAVVAVGDGVGAVALARGALSWTHSDRNGVPFAAVEEVGKLLAAERAREEALRRAEAAEIELGEVWRKLGRTRGELCELDPGSEVLRSTAHDLRAVDPETLATLDPKGVK